jgi:hypothetical protein
MPEFIEFTAEVPVAVLTGTSGRRDRFAANGTAAGSADGLVLRELGANEYGGPCREGSAIPGAAQVEPYLLEGCLAQDEVSSDPAEHTAGNPKLRDPRGGCSMLDFQTVARPPLPRIEVTDYIEMGRIAAEWATEPQTRPRDVAELRSQLAGVAVVPDRIRSIAFAQSTSDQLVLTLPAKEMVEESLERVADPVDDGRYPLPQFYADHCRPGFGPVMTPFDMLMARVGDYTIAQCR